LLVNDTNNDGLLDIIVAHGNGGGSPFSGILRQNLPTTGDATLEFSVADFSAFESAGVATVTIRRSGDPTAAVTVDYATTAGTAIAGQDFVQASGTLSFASGDLARSFDVVLIDDALQEGVDETVNLVLSNPSGGAVLGAIINATLAIRDDEPPLMPGEFGFSATTYSGSEASPSVAITIVRSNGSDGAAQVTLATSNGTAAAGQDYQTLSTVVAFVDGQTSAVESVFLIDDLNYEGNETVNMTLSNASGATLGSPTSAVLTILENEIRQPGVLQFVSSSASANETDGTISIDVSRVQGSDGQVTIDYEDQGVTAVSGVDYLPVSGTLIFADGVATQSVVMTLVDDTDFEAIETFEVQLFSPGGGASLGAIDFITIDIVSEDPEPANQAPVANADTASTNEDTVVQIAVLANDTDPDGDALSISAVGSPTNGVAVQSGNDIIYTPDADFNGNDSFSYTITDGALSASTTVSVSVTAVNDAPVANADSVTTNEDAAVQIAALANDVDPDGDVLSIASVGMPANGTAVQSGNGIIYTPNANFTGNDGFSYTVSDGTLSASTTVSVSVTTANDAPVANSDSASTAEDTPVQISVLLNDTDADGDVLSIASIGMPANGTAVQSGNSVTYTPDTDFNGNDSFSYTVTDGALSASATVSVAVSAVNDAPLANADSATTNEDVAVQILVLANDVDPDGDVLSIASVDMPANGTAVQSGNGITYTPNSNFSGNDSFSYTVSDGALSASTTVNIVVVAINDAPTANADSASTAEDTPVQISVLLNDTDPDGDALSIVSVGNAANGAAVQSSGGILYTPNANFNGNDSFNYTISDGSSTATAVVSVTISAVNDTPIAVSDSVSTAENVAVQISVLANDSDPDGDALSISSIGAAANGSAVQSADDIIYTPNANFSGVDNFSYTITDGSLTANAVVSIDVSASPDDSIEMVLSDIFVSEASGQIFVNLQRVGSGIGVVAVNIAATDGSATATNDYVLNDQLVTFADGILQASVAVLIVDDAVFEQDESFLLSISNAQGGTIGPSSTTTVTIVNDDAPPPAGSITFSVASLNVLEASGAVQIEIVRSSGTGGAVSVEYTTVGGSAISGEDYQFVFGVIDFADGVGGIKVISIPIVDDSAFEADEYFDVVLGAVTGGATLGSPAVTRVTIIDDDMAPDAGAIDFVSPVFDVNEADGLVTIDLVRSNGLAGAVSVDLITRDGTATATEDYQSVAVSISFSDGSSTASVNVPIVDNTEFEQSESFFIDLVNPQGGVTISNSTAEVRIADDDVAPATGVVQFSGDLTTIGEAAALVTVTAVRVGGSAGQILVDYQSVDGSATAGSDYQPVAGTVAFSDGQLSVSIDVPVVDDAVFEGDEDFTLTLSSTSPDTLGQRLSTSIVIQDNESPPSAGSFSLSQAATVVDEGAGSLSVAIIRSGGSSGAVSVDLATIAGSAIPGDDYEAVSRTVSFADGEISSQLSIVIHEDSEFESDELFGIELSNTTGSATLQSPSSMQVTIRDNDLPQHGIFDFDLTTYAVSEGQSDVRIGVTRSGGTDGDVSVEITVGSGSTASAADFSGASAVLSFLDGESAAELRISIVDDSLVEGSEFLNILLTNPQGGASIGMANMATVTIADNDTTVAPRPSSSGGGGSLGVVAAFLLLLVVLGVYARQRDSHCAQVNWLRVILRAK
jgi:hypothetical protein